ncbi:MAG: YraN family protein [Firmicutes bacterium]|nr:YraN family protein [Bacillota bacterium]
MDKTNKGKIGEDIAANYLKKSGYEIIRRNFRTELGEIDIIAAGEGYLIFVEVKLRKNEDFGYPSEWVTDAKIKKICQTASQYMDKFGLLDLNVRFDIIEVYFEQKEINHIKDAFESFLDF